MPIYRVWLWSPLGEPGWVESPHYSLLSFFQSPAGLGQATNPLWEIFQRPEPVLPNQVQKALKNFNFYMFTFRLVLSEVSLPSGAFLLTSPSKVLSIGT